MPLNMGPQHCNEQLANFTVPSYVIVFSSGLSLLYKRCHAVHRAAPGRCPSCTLLAASAPLACVELPPCFRVSSCAHWAPKGPQSLGIVGMTLACSSIGASCTGNPKRKVRHGPYPHEISSLGEHGSVFSKCFLTALCLVLSSNYKVYPDCQMAPLEAFKVFVPNLIEFGILDHQPFGSELMEPPAPTPTPYLPNKAFNLYLPIKLLLHILYLTL